MFQISSISKISTVAVGLFFGLVSIITTANASDPTRTQRGRMRTKPLAESTLLRHVREGNTAHIQKADLPRLVQLAASKKNKRRITTQLSLMTTAIEVAKQHVGTQTAEHVYENALDFSALCYSKHLAQTQPADVHKAIAVLHWRVHEYALTEAHHQLIRGELPREFGEQQLTALNWLRENAEDPHLSDDTFIEGRETAFASFKAAGQLAKTDRRFRFSLLATLGAVTRSSVTNPEDFNAFGQLLKAADITHEHVARNTDAAHYHDLVKKHRHHVEQSQSGSKTLATARAELAPFKKRLHEKDKQLILSRLGQDQLFKMQIFREALPDVQTNFVDPQAWITINTPELGAKIVDVLQTISGKPQNQLLQFTREKFGLTPKELTHEHAKFYADELVDVAKMLLTQISPKVAPSELKSLVDISQYTAGTTIRYTQRVLSDLTLGKKMGDCTDPLSDKGINAERATTWLYNHLYQMLTFGSGNNILGRLNIAPGVINHKPAIFVDATEIVPQARSNKPKHPAAYKALEDVLGFLLNLATKQRRDIYALGFSNADWVANFWQNADKNPPVVDEPSFNAKTDVEVTLPRVAPIRRALMPNGHETLELGRPFYQLLSFAENGPPRIIHTRATKMTPYLEEPQRPALKREIIDPIWTANHKVAQLLDHAKQVSFGEQRDNLLKQAATVILADATTTKKICALYNLPLAPSPAFLVPRLEVAAMPPADFKPESPKQQSVWQIDTLQFHRLSE